MNYLLQYYHQIIHEIIILVSLYYLVHVYQIQVFDANLLLLCNIFLPIKIYIS